MADRLGELLDRVDEHVADMRRGTRFDNKVTAGFASLADAVRLLAARPGEGDWLVIEWQRGDTVIRRVANEFALCERTKVGIPPKFSTFADAALAADAARGERG